MARVLREIEKRARIEGEILGRRHTIKAYLDARFGLDAKGLQDRVEEIVNLELLYQLGRDLFRADNLIKMEELIEAAIEEQKQITTME